MRHWMKPISCSSAFVHYCLVSSRSCSRNSRIGIQRTNTIIMPKKRSNVQMSSSSSSMTEGIMMILSPAKTLDLSPLLVVEGDNTTTNDKNNNNNPDDGKHNLSCSVPDCNPSQMQQVVTAMKKRKESELRTLLGISPKLAKTAHDYWTNFEVQNNNKNDSSSSSSHKTTTTTIHKPAIYAFSGAAYQGLDSSTCSKETILYLQQNLRIIDPLYGVLRPLDTIQPYRLEMATKNVLQKKDHKLADWWKPSVTQHLAKDLLCRRQPHHHPQHSSRRRILLNLASDEYSAAVDVSHLEQHTGCHCIKIVFWEEGRTIAVHAKRARGLMVRYIAEHTIHSIEGIQQFNVEGYSFQSTPSNESTFVFDRSKQPKPHKKKKTTTTTGTTTKRTSTTTNPKSPRTTKRSRRTTTPK